MSTTDERLQQWWDSLTPEHREALLRADLGRPLDADLVDVVTRAGEFEPAMELWWEQDYSAAVWHARKPVRDFIAARRGDTG